MEVLKHVCYFTGTTPIQRLWPLSPPFESGLALATCWNQQKVTQVML